MWYGGETMDETAIFTTVNNLCFVSAEDLFEAYVASGRWSPGEAYLLIKAAEVYLKFKDECNPAI